MKPEVDAEFASLIPPLSAEEYTQLEANLLAEGCRDSLVVWGNILIDGHNRLRICTKHNIPYTVASRDFPNREKAMEYIILNQLGRRNLSLGNRSLLYLKLEPLYKAKAKVNQQRSPGRGKKGSQNSENLFPGIDSYKEIAKIAGVSHDTIAKVKRIVEDGTEEQIERIKDGGKGNSVSAVYSEVRRAVSPVGAGESTAGKGLTAKNTTGKEPPAPPGDWETGRVSADDAQDANGAVNELDRIRGYVAEMKNPDLDRAFTTDMFLAEYEAFAQRFVRSIGAFCHAPYKEMYPLLADAEQEKILALNSSIVKAVRLQNSIVKEI